MAEVFLYNIEKSKAVKIKVLCHRMGIAARTVKREEFGVKLSSLLGLTEDMTAQSDSGFDAEMLFFSDFIPPILNLFLNQLRRQKTPVALKAVRTDANVGLTSCELYREIAAEHEALSGRRQ